MNPTANSGGGLLDSGNIGGFAYGIGISIGILVLLTTLALASYVCARADSSQSLAPPRPIHGGSVAIEVSGLDEAAILSCPKLLYSEAVKEEKGDMTGRCCSICLADYKGRDVLRLLPDCGHLFHCKCVDPWLHLRSTCPICRTSAAPTPLSTPLAEVVPLASRRD